MPDPQFREYWDRTLRHTNFASRLLAYTVTIMLVAIIVLTLQVQKRNESIKRVEEASKRTEQAAKDAQATAGAAKQTLDSAIALATSPSPQTIYSRQQLVNIERMLSQLTGQPVVSPPTTAAPGR